MKKPATGTIYTLTDPRNGRVRYVGKTTQTLLDRLGGHLANPTNPAMRVWINSLAVQGLAPHIQAVTTVAPEQLSAEEERQIVQHVKAGHRLLNAPYYHRNLSDLLEPVTKAVAPAKPVCGQRCDEFSARLFGPIATARAAGQMPRWHAAVHVLLRAPLASAATIWFGAASSRMCRRLGAAGIIAAYLWMVGFDRLVKRVVMAVLPEAQLHDFWSAYLSHPVQTLGWHALVMFLLAGCAQYSPVAEAAGVPRFGEQPMSCRPMSPSASRDLAARAAAALDAAVPQEPAPQNERS